MLHHDAGVLCAPTAFGKTVTAAAMIARRGVNTLVLVHRTELLKQWQERLQAFLGVGKGVVGTIGGGKAKATGKIDIAVMQSLSRQGEVNPLVESYGHVIVDECHHVGAVSFDAILKRTKAKYVLGLTATPIRRDGQQPIIFMQCGPIRYTAAKTSRCSARSGGGAAFAATRVSICRPRLGFRMYSGTSPTIRPEPAAIAARSRDRLQPRPQGAGADRAHRTSRRHSAALVGKVPPPFVLHGRMSRKQRAALIAELDALPPMLRAFCSRPASWSGRASTIRRSTPWCWRCRCRGKARCSSTPADCTASMPPRPTCGSSISWTPVTRRCCECGTSASVDTRPWGIESRNRIPPISSLSPMDLRGTCLKWKWLRLAGSELA